MAEDNISNLFVSFVSNKVEINNIIRTVDQDLDKPVSKMEFYDCLLEKVSANGAFLVANCNCCILGYCAFYANNMTDKIGFITLIAVARKSQNKQVGTKLLNISIETMKKMGMKYCKLEVRKENYNAVRFYEKNGFCILEEKEKTFLMERSL